MKRLMLCLLALCSMVTVHGQGSSQTRSAFLRQYPPKGPTYAVVVRGDLPTVGINGARGRDRGRAKLPIELTDAGWKQAGSIGRQPPTGTLTSGEVLQVENIDYAGDGIDIRLRSVESHEIARDPDKPERSRREPVVTELRVPYDGEIRATLALLDRYVRLFTTLDAARAYQATLGHPQPDKQFSLAIMRRDGVMVPIASYDNGRWYNRWPQPSAEQDVPISMAHVPPEWWGVEGPGAWTLWTPDGQAKRVQVAAPLGFDAHCLMNVGLRTDYRSPLPVPPLDEHHYPKDALVTNGSIRVEQVQTLDASHPNWKTVQAVLSRLLQIEELREAQNLLPTDPRFKEVKPGVQAMSQVPMNLEVLCTANNGSGEALTAYFEAAKRYDPIDKTGPNPCGSVTFFSGWVHGTSTGQGYLDKNATTRLSDCTRWNLEFRRPLGLLRLGNRPYWIMQVSRWGGESYEVMEIGDDLKATLVLSTSGGWCREIGN